MHKPLSDDNHEHKERLLYESETIFKRNGTTGSGTPVNLLAQMGYPHRGVAMKEEMGAVITTPEFMDEVTDRISPRGKFPPELWIQANERLNLEAKEAGGGTLP